MENLPQPKTGRPLVYESYISYHFSVALPNFIRTRPAHLIKVAEFFNITELFLHLFTPYRRLILIKKTTLWDRLSFSLISIMVGAIVRLLLIIAGFIALVFFAIFDVFAIVLYAIPLYSYLEFANKKQAAYSQKDLEDSKRFLEKLLRSQFFKTLTIFLDTEFQNILKTIPSPVTFGATTKHNIVEILTVTFENFPPLKAYFAKYSLDLAKLTLLLNYVKKSISAPSAKITPIGQMLSFGYTVTLDKFGSELTIQALPHHLAKKEFLEKIQNVLLRPESNNVLLVGEVGVGRHSALESLATAIAKMELPKLTARRLILLDTTALLASSKNILEIKASFEQLLQEAKHAGNIILAIDSIDRIMSPEDSRLDLSEVLSTTLTDNQLPIIGITTTDDYSKYIRSSSHLTSLFEKIDVEEPKAEETLTILIGKVIEEYKKTGVSVQLPSLVEIVNQSGRLIADRFQPEKSIIVLSDCIAAAKNEGKKLVDIGTVDQVLSQITKVPLGKIAENEKAKLKDLEGYLHKRIVGQEEAIIEISKAMRRSRAGIDRSQKTMGAFLFLGPTGVGKTETAKALADAYFGSASKMIRLDMTEFQSEDSIKRLIGDPGNKTPGQLTSLVRQNPFGLLLLDEFEKANINVQNLFLQIIDEGNLTDAFGKKVNFENIILIATSNAAAEYIREEVEKGEQNLSQKLINFVLEKALFTPELINRFDAVVVYHPLTRVQINQVAKLMLIQLANSLKETKNITLEISDELAQKVATDGYIVAFGARPIRRLIQDKLEDEIAKMIINGEALNGSTIPAATLLKFLD